MPHSLSLAKDVAANDDVKELRAKLLERELYRTAESIESYCDNSTLKRRIREALPRVIEELRSKSANITSRQRASTVDRGSTTRADAVQQPSQPIRKDSVERNSGNADSQPSSYEPHAPTSYYATDTESESEMCPKPKLSVGCAAKEALALNESSDSDSNEEGMELKSVGKNCRENTSPVIHETRRNHRGGTSCDRTIQQTLSDSDKNLLELATISTLKQENKKLQDAVQSKDDEIKELRRQMATLSDPKDLVRDAIAANKESYNAALASKDLEINYLKSDLGRAQDRVNVLNRLELTQIKVIAELREQHQAERTQADEEHAGKLNALRESYEAKYIALQAQLDLIRGFQQKSI